MKLCPTTGDPGNHDRTVEDDCWNPPWMTTGQTTPEKVAGPGRL